VAAFRLEPTVVAETRARARYRGLSPEVHKLIDGVRQGAILDAESLAALFLSPLVDTDVLLELAHARRAGTRIETFSPLYLTNECDAECAMCGMRRFNQKLIRETADDETLSAQLDILHRRGLRGVAILTGEYHDGLRRRQMIARATRALNGALDRGFEHVLINIGSIERDEYQQLLSGVPRDAHGNVIPRLTMCTFQETYDRTVYSRFMGSNPDNPRSDFDRRLENFDRAADAGMKSVNPGVLLGLNQDVASELLALLWHVEHLQERGLSVCISLPRLRKASGTEYRCGISDEVLYRVVSLLAVGAPEAKVVISTREAPAVQRRLLPLIGVLTPGSPGVAPYTETGARFEREASQFEVLDERPIETILGEVLASGTDVGGYVPRGTL
jgi:3-methyl-2-indolic acid synthase